VIPIVSIVGRSGSGKTTLLEKLVGELKARNYKVAVVKHAGHGFEIDHPGKDSWRFMQAGADSVVVSSSGKLALVRSVEHELSVEDLSRIVGADFDIILTEGYGQDRLTKIEVHRKELCSDLTCSPQQLLAVVTDEPLETSVAQYAMDDVVGISDLIEQMLLNNRGEDISLFVNGKFIPLNPSSRETFAGILAGMVLTLEGIEEVGRLDIWLKGRPEDWNTHDC